MAMPKSTPRRPGNPGQNRDSRDGVFGHPESQVGPLPRVGLYARVSTPHQHTIRMQLRQLREFLERRRWQEVLVVEEVVSGSRRRPERDRLLDAARRREIDIIAVWRLDRWGRSLSDLMLTLRELQELDVAFVSLTEAFDLTTSTGRAMAAMVAVFAEFEREIRRERVRAGIEQARHERNLPISGPAGSLRVIFHTVAAQTPWCPIKSAGVRISAMRVTSCHYCEPGFHGEFGHEAQGALGPSPAPEPFGFGRLPRRPSSRVSASGISGSSRSVTTGP